MSQFFFFFSKSYSSSIFANFMTQYIHTLTHILSPNENVEAFYNDSCSTGITTEMTMNKLKHFNECHCFAKRRYDLYIWRG